MVALGVFLGVLGIAMIAQGVTAQTPPPVGPGNWIIPNGDSTIITDDTITLEGNLIVKPTGELILNTVTLKFDCSTDGEFGFYNYGSLNVDANSALASVTANAWTFQLFSGSTTLIANTVINKLGYEDLGNTTRWGLRVDNGAIASFSDLTYSDGFEGIEVRAESVTISNSDFSLIEMTIIQLKSSADDALIDGNTLDGGMYGITVEGAEGVRITQNEISDPDVGIYLFSDFGEARIDNNTLDGGGIGDSAISTFPFSSGDLIVENNTITDWTSRGVDTVDAGATVHYNNVSFCKYGLELYDGSVSRNNNLWNNTWGMRTHATISSTNDSIVNSSYTDIKSYDDVLTLTNTQFITYIPSMDSSDIIAVRWYLDVQIIDEDGEPVDGASVNITNNTDEIIFLGNTDSDGWVRWVLLPEFNATNEGEHSFNPYTINAQKAGSVGEVTVNITGDQDDVVLTIYQTDLTSTVWVNIYNQFTNLGVIDELLKLEFSMDGANWTRIPEKHMVFAYSSATVYLRLLDFMNQTVASTTKLLTQGDVYWDAPVPLLTFHLEPQYDVDEFTFTRNGEEIGFFGNEITVLGGLYGDETIIYELSWKSKEIELEDGTNWTIVPGSINLTAMGDETRKVGFLKKSIPMKLQSKYVKTPPEDDTSTFKENLLTFWNEHELEITIGTTILGFVGLAVAIQRLMIAQKNAQRTEEIASEVTELKKETRAQKRARKAKATPTRSRPGRPAPRVSNRSQRG